MDKQKYATYLFTNLTKTFDQVIKKWLSQERAQDDKRGTLKVK